MTIFEEMVLEKLKAVPVGKVTTYAALASAVGRPKSARAVGNALHKNPWAPDVPCHRVVSSNGSLGGYALGSQKKIALLRREGVQIENDKVLDFVRLVFLFDA